MEFLAGLFMLMAAAAAAAWQMSDVLVLIEARIRARREGLRVQRITYLWFVERYRREDG